MALSSKVHFFFPYRAKDKDKSFLLSELDEDHPFLHIGENETVLVYREGDEKESEVSLRLDNYYEVDKETYEKLMNGENVEFSDMKETEDGSLVLENGHIYVILNGGDNNVGLIPGTYFLYVHNLLENTKIKVPFYVSYLKNVNNNSMSLLKEALEKLSKGITASSRPDIFNRGEEVVSSRLDYSLKNEEYETFLNKLNVLKQGKMFSLVKTIKKERSFGKQDPVTARKNLLKADNDSFFNVHKVLSYDLPINQMLKHYLLLIKNTLFSLSRKTAGRTSLDYKLCYQSVLKVLNDCFKNVSDSNGAFLSESFFFNPLYSYFLKFYRKIEYIEKNGNDLVSLRYKDSSEIFELGGMIFLKNIFEDLGFVMKEMLLPLGEDINDFGYLSFEDDKYQIRVFYDYPCDDCLSSAIDRMVTINSHNNRPDYLVEIFEKGSLRLKDVLALEMKYRKYNFCEGNDIHKNDNRLEKLRKTLQDYIQLAYKDKEGKIERAVVSKVYLFFPGKDNVPTTNFSYGSKICGIDIISFLNRRGNIYDAMKEDFKKILD